MNRLLLIILPIVSFLLISLATVMISMLVIITRGKEKCIVANVTIESTKCSNPTLQECFSLEQRFCSISCDKPSSRCASRKYPSDDFTYFSRNEAELAANNTLGTKISCWNREGKVSINNSRPSDDIFIALVFVLTTLIFCVGLFAVVFTGRASSWCNKEVFVVSCEWK